MRFLLDCEAPHWEAWIQKDRPSGDLGIDGIVRPPYFGASHQSVERSIRLSMPTAVLPETNAVKLTLWVIQPQIASHNTRSATFVVRDPAWVGGLHEEKGWPAVFCHGLDVCVA